MESKLIAAYLALQLDPNNDQQAAAFETLCWKHVFRHTSSHWVEQVQRRALSLVREIKSDTRGRHKTYAYDHTLDRLTFEFMQEYARVIWPSTETDRTHLSAKQDGRSKLRATSGYIRAHSSTQTKLERESGKPCTEQMIVVESVIGRRVREFLKELITTRVVPSLGDHSADLLLYMVLGWAEATALETPRHLEIPKHPEITSERFPCPAPGCSRIYAWSEALTAHFDLAHVGSGPGLATTKLGVPTRPTLSNLPDDNSDSHPPPKYTWVPSQRGDTQTDTAIPLPSSIVAPHGTGSIDSSNHYSADVLSLMSSDDEEDSEGNGSGSSSMFPDHWTDTQMESKFPAPSSIDTPHEAGPIDSSNPDNAEVVSVISLDDGEDSEDDTSGLLCPHDGCQHRFPDWASFEAHAQLPHNDSRRVLNGGEVFTTNAVADSDDLREAMDTS